MEILGRVLEVSGQLHLIHLASFFNALKKSFGLGFFFPPQKISPKHFQDNENPKIKYVPQSGKTDAPGGGDADRSRHQIIDIAYVHMLARPKKH